MALIEDFLRASRKRVEKNALDFSVGEPISLHEVQIDNSVKAILPGTLKEFYSLHNGLKINKPREFEILRIEELKILNSRYLIFSIFNGIHMICLDTESINTAGEMDIVNFDTNYLITKTMGSFFTNKVWAWVDRGRKIWGEEIYD